MPQFSEKSLHHRATLHKELIRVLNAVMEESTEEQDFAIICGLRNEADQNLAYANGNSKKQYPKSHHNGTFVYVRALNEKYNQEWDYGISDAVDVVPYPVEWPDKKNDTPYEYIRKMTRFYELASRIMYKAQEMRIKLQWGGMFASFDGPHFQRKRQQ